MIDAIEVKGACGEISGARVSKTTSFWLQTLVSLTLTAGVTVDPEDNPRATDGYFAADQTANRRTKIGRVPC